MNKSKIEEISYIFLTITLVLYIVNLIYAYKYGHFGFHPERYKSRVFLIHVLFIVTIIGIIFSNYFRNKKILLLLPIILMVLQIIYTVVDIVGATYRFNLISKTIINTLNILSYFSLSIMILLFLRESAILKKVWFLPGIISLVPLVIEIFNFDYVVLMRLVNTGGPSYLFSLRLVFSLLNSIILFILTYIFKNNYEFPFIYDFNSNSKVGKADDLLIYKELYDDGIITEEEFEDKKRKNLNLK